MNQLKNIIPYSALQLVYFTLVQSHWDYKGLVYLKALSLILFNFQKIQKRMCLSPFNGFLPFGQINRWQNRYIILWIFFRRVLVSSLL